MRFLPVLFLGLVVGLTLRFNYYKLPWIYHLSQLGLSYQIFPWSYPGQISLSPHWWLIIHSIMGMTLQIITVLRMGLDFPQKARRVLPNSAELNFPLIKTVHRILHYLFSGLVLINIHHFGQAPPIIAILLQGTLLAIMQWRKKGWIYFLALSSAPLLEVGLYILERVL